MKKILAVLLAIGLLFSVACAEGTMVGGWTVNEEEALPEAASEALRKATDGLLGCTYEPIACLGSQLVSGMNHCLLCRLTPVVPDAVSQYALVYVYADLNGGAQITDIIPLDISNPEALKVPEMPDGQNPVMDIVGPYDDAVSGRAHMMVQCLGETGASVEIRWADSASECVVWRFTGEYDTASKTIAYSDCEKAVEIFDENGSMTKEVLYENGLGRLVIGESYEILWQDDMEDAGKECVFRFEGK